ncbi:MAG: hypothetical protein OXR68_07425 [Alphaproteobacteria bacterium]|nr:hypothetical protein [Alphaproteobacteria bacterium]
MLETIQTDIHKSKETTVIIAAAAGTDKFYQSLGFAKGQPIHKGMTIFTWQPKNS